MPVAVILIVLGSAMLHAAWNCIIKGGQDKLSETAFNAAGGALLALCVLPALPALPAAAWPYLALSTFVHLAYYLCLALAYGRLDLSFAYTLMRGAAPLLTALTSVLVLQQPVSGGGWVSLGLICFGILLMAGDAIRKSRLSWLPTLVALGNAFIIMLYTTLDGEGVRVGQHALTYGCWLFLLDGLCLLMLNLLLRRQVFSAYANKKRLLYGMGGGVASLLAYTMVLWGMTQAPVPLVAGLRESSVVFGMLGAVLFLGEKLSLLRLISIAFVLAGAVSLRFV